MPKIAGMLEDDTLFWLLLLSELWVITQTAGNAQIVMIGATAATIYLGATKHILT